MSTAPRDARGRFVWQQRPRGASRRVRRAGCTHRRSHGPAHDAIPCSGGLHWTASWDARADAQCARALVHFDAQPPVEQRASGFPHGEH